MIGYLFLVTLQNTKKIFKKNIFPNEDLETIFFKFFFFIGFRISKEKNLKIYIFFQWS